MKLQDYIQYYVGCRVIIDPGTTKEETGRLMGVCSVPNSINQIYYHIVTDQMAVEEDEDFCMPYNDDADEPARIKPILRKLESLTEEQVKHLIGWDKLQELYVDVSYELSKKWIAVNYSIDAGDEGVYNQRYVVDFNVFTPTHFHYLLRQHFDLFGLIDAGLAVDANKQD